MVAVAFKITTAFILLLLSYTLGPTAKDIMTAKQRHRGAYCPRN